MKYAPTALIGEDMSISVPLFRSVDLLIIGTSAPAVQAAVAASRIGATVFCITDTTYPGEDICAPFRLWPDRSLEQTPLFRSLFESPRETPAPMHIKRTLERTLLKAGVEYLYMSYPAFLVRNQSGKAAGLIIANRSGFQLIRAKAIIDATSRAVVARMAGAAFDPWKPGEIAFYRMVAGGNPAPGIPSRKAGDIRLESKTAPVHEYRLSIETPSAEPGQFSAAECTARLATWHPRQLFGSDRLFFIPPDRLAKSGARLENWRGAANADLAAFRCGEEPVFVLGVCADCSDAVAQTLSEPGPLMAVGERLGIMAANCARQSRQSNECFVDYQGVAAEDSIAVTRRDSYFRLEDAESIQVDVRRMRTFATCDVFIAGGGTAGAPAAISAGRAGANTILTEYLPGLGGVGTEGRIARYWHGNRVGFTAEIDLGVHDLAPQSEFPLGDSSWNSEWKKQWYLREASLAGVAVWFGALGIAAVCDNARVCGVAVATPYAPAGLVRARATVDATGNADIAAAAGAESVVISKAHVAVQGTGLSPVKPGVHYTNTDHTFVDDSDVQDVTRAFTLAREKFSDSFDLSQLVDTRQRRQVRGEIELDALDFLAKRTFPDTVVIARSNFDSHGFTIHPVFMAKAPDKQSHDAHVPFRALLPRGLEGVLVTGLGVSAHRDALPVIRMQADVQNQGYAAGYAAYLCARLDQTYRQIDIRALQRKLVETGILPVDILINEDSFPLGEKALHAAVRDGIDTYRGLAAIFGHRNETLPMLRSAWTEAADPALRLRYAHVMALMGDDTGLETLIEELDSCDWDQGWEFTGMHQFGFSLSPVDSMLIAVARTKNARAHPVLMRMLISLAPEREFSHVRALTLAFEQMPHPDAAVHFARLLEWERNHGHARESIAAAAAHVSADPVDTTERNGELRELLIARGLYACGDYEGKARATLQAYANDLHGHYARHARALLKA